jgi:hypothetical protein
MRGTGTLYIYPPAWVSGSSETKTYGKDATVSEQEGK